MPSPSLACGLTSPTSHLPPPNRQPPNHTTRHAPRATRHPSVLSCPSIKKCRRDPAGLGGVVGYLQALSTKGGENSAKKVKATGLVERGWLAGAGENKTCDERFPFRPLAE